MAGFENLYELALELFHLVLGDILEQAVDAAVDDGDLVLDGPGMVLCLDEEALVLASAVDDGCGDGVDVAAELGEGLEFAVLCLGDLEGAGHFLHGLDLGAAAYAAHGDAHVDGGADALVEQGGLKENLAVGDGDDVGGDVCRHVACLGLDDWKGGQRAAALDDGLEDFGKVVHGGGDFLAVDDLGGAFEQAAVEVEDVAWIGLASGGALEDQRYLAVGDGLLGEVVVYDEGVAAGVADELADGHACEGGVVAHGGGVGGGGGHHYGVGHGAELLQGVHGGGDGGCLLADGDVDAVDGLAGFVVGFLVDDGVDGDGGLANLAVADDELALSATDGNHGVDCLETGLERLLYGLAEDYAGSLALKRHEELLALDGPFAVDGFAEDVDDAAEDALAYGDGGDFAGAAHGHVLVDAVYVVEQYDADVAFLEVEGHAFDAVLELYELVGAYVLKTVHVGYAVAYFEHGAHFLEFYLVVDVFELLFQDVGYFAWVEHLISCCLLGFDVTVVIRC